MSASHEIILIDRVVSALEVRSDMMERQEIAGVSKREIAFIDRGVDDLAILVAGMRSGVEPILLSNDEAAPRQMARAVEGRNGLEAIHVIAHGRSGEVSFVAGNCRAKRSRSTRTISRSSGWRSVTGFCSCGAAIPPKVYGALALSRP